MTATIFATAVMAFAFATVAAVACVAARLRERSALGDLACSGLSFFRLTRSGLVVETSPGARERYFAGKRGAVRFDSFLDSVTGESETARARRWLQGEGSPETELLAMLGGERTIIRLRWLPGFKRIVVIDDTAFRENPGDGTDNPFSRIFRLIPDPVSLSMVESGFYFDVNDRFGKLTGYSRDEIIGRSSTELGIWANPRERDELVRKLGREGVIVKESAQLRRKDGNLIPVEISASLIDAGGFRCLLSITRDLTESNKTERSLRSAEERFSSIVKNLPVALIAVRTSDSRIFELNDAAVRLFGVDRIGIIGADPAGLGLDPDAISEGEGDGDDGALSSRKVEIRRPGRKTAHCMLTAYRASLNDIPCVIMSLQDVSDTVMTYERAERSNRELEAKVEERTRKIAHALQTLEETQSELVKAETNAALGALVRGFSRRISSPLRTIAMLATELHSGLSSLRSHPGAQVAERLDPLREKLAGINSRLEKARDLIGLFKLLGYERSDTKTETFDIAYAVDVAMRSLSAKIQKSPCRIDVESGLEIGSFAESWHDTFIRVITIILDNAVEHAFSGRQKGMIRLSIRDDGDDKATVMVEDDGTGIPRDRIASIFEPFNGPDESLGLYVAQSISSKILGGTITAAGEEGKGSVFSLSIPLHPLRDGQSRLAPYRSPAGDTGVDRQGFRTE